MINQNCHLWPVPFSQIYKFMLFSHKWHQLIIYRCGTKAQINLVKRDYFLISEIEH